MSTDCWTNSSAKVTDFVATCPIHQGTNENQFSMKLSKNIFKCFARHCRVGGNMLDFMAAMEGTDFHTAALTIARWFDIK